MKDSYTSQDGKSLSEQVADRLIKHIVDEGLEQGDRLPNEKDLCELLQVGRSTLREAVRMLSSRNILTVRHGSGIYISDQMGLSDDPLGFIFVKDKLKLVVDLVDFRMMIEPRMAAMAAQRASTQDVEELRRAEFEIEQQIIAHTSHAKEDAIFHGMIARLSGNSILPKLEPILFNAIDLFITLSQSRLVEQTIEEHRAIVEAIASRDAVRAHDEMVLHLVNNRRFISSRLEEARMERGLMEVNPADA